VAVFNEVFASYRSSEEQSSELYNMFLTGGDRVEKALVEDISNQVRSSRDFVAFDERLVRSWLGALLRMVPNVTPAATVSDQFVQVSFVKDTSLGPINIYGLNGLNPDGVMYLRTRGGVQFTILNDWSGTMDGVANLQVRQGRQLEQTGIYTNIIQVLDTSLVIDSSLLKVEVSESGGDAVYTEVPFVDELVSPLTNASSSFVVPSGGYYAWSSGSVVFIRVFPGWHTDADGNKTYISDPEGWYYRVTYWTCLGGRGNVAANSISQFVGGLKDSSSPALTVTPLFSHTAIVGGYDAPTVASLVTLLRATFFASTTLASVPEYRAWLLAQPAVGEAVVRGDFERYRLTGSSAVTGVVDIYAVGVDGNPLSSAVKADLLDKLDKVRDLAFIEGIKDLGSVNQFFEYRYSGADVSDTELQNYFSTTLASYFQVSAMRNKGLSVADVFDLDNFREDLQANVDVQGSLITAYHVNYARVDFESVLAGNPLKLSGFGQERIGGYYELWLPCTGLTADPMFEGGEPNYSYSYVSDADMLARLVEDGMVDENGNMLVVDGFPVVPVLAPVPMRDGYIVGPSSAGSTEYFSGVSGRWFLYRVFTEKESVAGDGSVIRGIYDSSNRYVGMRVILDSGQVQADGVTVDYGYASLTVTGLIFGEDVIQGGYDLTGAVLVGYFMAADQGVISLGVEAGVRKEWGWRMVKVAGGSGSAVSAVNSWDKKQFVLVQGG